MKIVNFNDVIAQFWTRPILSLLSEELSVNALHPTSLDLPVRRVRDGRGMQYAWER
jgi:hypothetical protein